jgi:prepilin-type N-terminal cleavage/methylation domain-containing protein
MLLPVTDRRFPVPRRSRPGLTLMEVLVAIFIMAIGMLALLTLFPLGALRMEQAIRDDKCAQAGMQAIELAKILDLTSDPAVRAAMTDANAKDAGGNPLPAGMISTTPGPSKAVVVDPIAYAPAPNNYVDAGTKNLARVPSNYANNYYDDFTLTDDLVFQLGTGTPRQFGTTIGREPRFSWSYVLQQPQVQNPGVTNCSICIYNRRPLVAPFEFTLPSATLDLANSTITYDSSAQPKQILPGQWVLDATLSQGTSKIPLNTSGGLGKVSPLANFYRIVNVRQGAMATQTVLDLQTPFRGYYSTTTNDPDPSTVYPPPGVTLNPVSAPVLIIQDSLVEVIDVGPIR